MATKTKTPISKIVFYFCAGLMAFSIFMFFMEVLEWTDNLILTTFKGIANPSFFDLIFGNYGSEYVRNWPVVGGMVVLFIFQLVITTTCLVIAGLLFFKKINKHTAICVLTGVGVLAIICGVLAFCSKLMIDRKSLDSPWFLIDSSLKNKMGLNYGAYVYGITMITAAVGSLGAFILDHYNK